MHKATLTEEAGLKTKGPVACKVLLPAYDDASTGCKCLLREAIFMAGLKHQ